MKFLEKLAVRLSFTKAEITLVSALLGFLVLGGVLKHVRSAEKAETLIKKAEAARYSEAEVDSLITLATAEQRTVEHDVVQEGTEETGTQATHKRTPRHTLEKKVFNGTISFNRANAQQLQKIPGVGPVMAERLIAFRTEKGGKVHEFEDFLQVQGIGEKKLEFLKKYFTLE